jgi:hypothetical protein
MPNTLKNLYISVLVVGASIEIKKYSSWKWFEMKYKNYWHANIMINSEFNF